MPLLKFFPLFIKVLSHKNAKCEQVVSVVYLLSCHILLLEINLFNFSTCFLRLTSSSSSNIWPELALLPTWLPLTCSQARQLCNYLVWDASSSSVWSSRRNTVLPTALSQSCSQECPWTAHMHLPHRHRSQAACLYWSTRRTKDWSQAHKAVSWPLKQKCLSEYSNRSAVPYRKQLRDWLGCKGRAASRNSCLACLTSTLTGSFLARSIVWANYPETRETSAVKAIYLPRWQSRSNQRVPELHRCLKAAIVHRIIDAKSNSHFSWEKPSYHPLWCSMTAQ